MRRLTMAINDWLVFAESDQQSWLPHRFAIKYEKKDNGKLTGCVYLDLSQNVLDPDSLTTNKKFH